MSNRTPQLLTTLLLTAFLAFTVRRVLAARYGSPAIVGPAPASGVLRVYLKAMSAAGPHRLVFTNLRTGAVSSVSTPGGSYGLVGLATTLGVAGGDSVRTQMFNDNTGGSPAPGYEDPISAWKCNGGDDFGDLYGLAAAAGAPIVAVQCWEDYTDGDYNDVAVVVSYEPATVATNTPTRTRTPTPAPTFTATPMLTDLSVNVSNNASSVTAGASTTYLVVVSNAGPSLVSNVSVIATLGSELTGLTWTCSATSGACGLASGSGDINSTVSVNVGGSATFVVTGLVRPDAIGNASASAGIRILSGEVDTNPANDSASDSDPILVSADLAIAKSNGSASVIPGTDSIYTIVVVNHGPSAVIDASVTDYFPAQFSNTTWSCVASSGSCSAASGLGDITAALSLGPGGSATFTATGSARPDVTGTVSNTALVSVPTAVTDPDPTNNTATDSDTLTPIADIAITKSAAPSSLAPGQWVRYTLSVNNAGPSDAPGVSVVDDLTPDLTNTTWTCFASPGSSCAAASGVGSIATTVDLRTGGTATFILNARVRSTATGVVNNVALASVPVTVTEPDPANNSSGNTPVTLFPQAGLAIAKGNGVNAVTPGLPVMYTIIVNNGGPSAASGIQVQDIVPIQLTGVRWTCTATTNASCSALNGTGSLSTTVSLLDGGQATFHLTGDVPPDAHLSGTGITNTASFTAPFGLSVLPGFNTSTDSDPYAPRADLALTMMSDATPGMPPGTPITQRISLVNNGPSMATNTRLTYTLPPGAEIVTLQSGCTLAGQVMTCSFGILAVNAVRDIVVVIRHTQEGTLTTSATAVSDVSDPVLANNSATLASFAGPHPTAIPANTSTLPAPTPTAPIISGWPTSTPAPLATLTLLPSPSPAASLTASAQPSQTPVVVPVPLTAPPASVPSRSVWPSLYGLVTALMGGLLCATMAHLRDPRPAVIHQITRLAAGQILRRQDYAGE